MQLKGGGRSSARETIGRVAAGAVAKKILKDFAGTEVCLFSVLGELSGCWFLYIVQAHTFYCICSLSIQCLCFYNCILLHPKNLKILHYKAQIALVSLVIGWLFIYCS